MINKTKYIYFFRGDLSSHVGIYKSWVDITKDEININLFTILDTKTYQTQKNLVEYYRKQDVVIKVVPRYFKVIYIIMYFLFMIIKYKKVVVHLRKQSPKPFDLIKRILPNRLKYIIEIEGDFESEIDYLSHDKNKYKDGFYNEIVKGMKKASLVLEEQFFKADGIFVVTKELKELFIKRYSKNDISNKIYAIPTGFDNTKFYPDDELRKRYRKEYNLEDKFVMIFTGNVLYSWQNIKRSIEVFKLLKRKLYTKMYFVMLIRKEDHCIINEFISKLDLKKEDFLLTNVSHEDVNGFLNASDIGILLRENDTLNKVASPGKLGEYLSSGLNILTTRHIGLYSKVMMTDKVGIIVDDIFDDKEILDKVQSFVPSKTKKEQNKWASDNFSVQAYKEIYINSLKNI